MKKESENRKKFLTLKEVLKEYATRPRPKFLWNGIKENSFGLVFGPSKSGKTIFCENLGMKIAVGSKEFFGYSLDGTPKKVLFIGLEEFWENRAERNKIQLEQLNDNEQKLLQENYLFQEIEFPGRILNDSDWERLEQMIRSSKAKVVFIDSITRMNPGKLENSADAEKVMQKLRDICYNNKITLVCIHHTPKMYDQPITMDSIKGSSVFAQESDFAIGVNRTAKGFRYIKNVFFRYASDDFEKVKEFNISPSTWLEHINDVEEVVLINKSDRRRADENREKMIEYFDENTCVTFETKELIGHFTSNLSIKTRQVQTHLSELVNSNKISSPQRGHYKSINCIKDKEDEKEK